MKKDLIKTLLAFSLFTATASYSTQAATGDLYDGGLNDQKVYKFDTAGNRTVFVSGSTTFQPDRLAFDSKGNLFASNPAHSAISKIPPDGSTITDFATGINPGDLAFDAAGNLFAFDATSGSIFKYTPSGARSGFAGPGLPSGPLHDVVALAFASDGTLFATRRGSGLAGTGSIVKFTSSGTMSTFYPAQPGGLFLPMGLAFDGFGNLYEADSGSGSIFKFAPNGTKTTFKTGLNAPRSLAFDRNGILFVGEFGGNDIVKITPAGSLSPFASATAVGGLAFEPPTAQLTNISTRASVKTGTGVTIGGFIVTGTASKQVVIRGLGPTLGQPPFNLPNVLADPTLDLHDSNGSIATNDNWKDTQQAAIQATGLAPPNDSESAILITLQPGDYTAILAGKNGTTGVGLVEVYDINAGVFAELTNVSTRGFVGSGQSVMIGGFISGATSFSMGGGGNGSTQVVVRGLGPTLTQFGVSGALADPVVTLVDGNGNAVKTNDNWKNTQQTAIQATGLAPPNDLESAMVVTVAAGNYTAILSGKNGGTGIGLIEVYNIK
jgi:sugar lactone lactonase YvrE